MSEKLFPYQVITYNKDHKKAKNRVLQLINTPISENYTKPAIGICRALTVLSTLRFLHQPVSLRHCFYQHYLLCMGAPSNPRRELAASMARCRNRTASLSNLHTVRFGDWTYLITSRLITR